MVTSNLTLDGVMQSNGKPEPELNDGFRRAVRRRWGAKPGMHECGRSDAPVVPANLANKAAEAEEDKGTGQREHGQQTRPGRSAGPGVSNALDRARGRAKG
jgi:hypothetical protein